MISFSCPGVQSDEEESWPPVRNVRISISSRPGRSAAPSAGSVEAVVISSRAPRHGASMNALGRMFGVRASSVLKWIRRYATEHDVTPGPSGKAVVMELDEMWHFLQNNGANAGSGKLWIVLQASSWTGSGGVVIKQP
jgi:hypothetical protein